MGCDGHCTLKNKTYMVDCDRCFDQLKKDIEKTQKELEGLQAVHNTQTGRDFVRQIVL